MFITNTMQEKMTWSLVQYQSASNVAAFNVMTWSDAIHDDFHLSLLPHRTRNKGNALSGKEAAVNHFKITECMVSNGKEEVQRECS